LYCNLVAAGEQAGILETLLDRLANYKEKMIAIKIQDQGGAVLSGGDHRRRLHHYGGDHDLRDSGIQGGLQEFRCRSADADAHRDRHVGFRCRVLVGAFGGIGGSIYAFFYTWKRSEAMQIAFDRMFLRLPVFGDIIRKSVIARWTRTLATMFAAGVPLVESLESVGGAAGNYVYKAATRQIQSEVSTGTSLTSAMQNTELFPNMVNQMVAIGEESGALDSMLGKVADFFEAEVDDAVERSGQPHGADDHGRSRGADRRHGDRHVPADLQAGRCGRIMLGALTADLDPTLFTLICGVVGLLVGSFLNVVIHRLPR
jgi:type IV pilus assembly protein PilC